MVAHGVVAIVDLGTVGTLVVRLVGAARRITGKIVLIRNGRRTTTARPVRADHLGLHRVMRLWNAAGVALDHCVYRVGDVGGKGR